MAAASPDKAFDALRDYEKRALIHAVGLPEQTTSQGTWSGIAYRLAGANLVSEIGDIVEILNLPEFTRVPGSQTWMLGVANVRGNLVPIIDLRGYLSGKPTVTDKHTRVLVVPQHGGTAGLIIDEVTGQRHFLDEEESEGNYYSEHMVGKYVDREYEKNGDYWAALSMRELTSDAQFQNAAV